MNIKTILGVLVIAAIAAGIFYARSQTNVADDPADQASAANSVTVFKTASCGCCVKWVDHLRANDMEINVVNVASTAPTRGRLGVPNELGSCHTAEVAGYWVEGHVPADLVQKLVSDKPSEIRGLAAPGMPMGSPGMEGPNPVEYDIIAHHVDGTTSVYATRQGKTAVE